MQHTNDAELKQILQQTIMLQNGMVASLMARSGVRGLMNYGVSLVDLRNIARQYGVNHSLAQRLCPLQIREAKILASLLFDPNALNDNDLMLIANSITNIDMAENFAQNIVSKIAGTTFFDTLCGGDRWQVVAAIHAVGWAVSRQSANAAELTEWFTANIGNIARLGLTETAQPLLATIRTIAEKSPDSTGKLKRAAENFANAETDFAKNIGRQIVEELA